MSARPLEMKSSLDKGVLPYLINNSSGGRYVKRQMLQEKLLLPCYEFTMNEDQDR